MRTHVERAVEIAARSRALLGITGAPGAGKCTFAEHLARAVEARGISVAVVPMDGFHLAQAELGRLGRVERKGAPDTFDAHGFVALLRRIAVATETVYAPAFDRTLEEPIAGAIPVPPDADLIIVEGNYLLLDREPWDQVAGLLTECWFVELDETTRLERLIARHVAHGRSPEAARAHALGSDQRNAEAILAARHRADAVVTAD